MSSTFFGINVAASGLAAQQQAISVLSENIAHASDTSYKRQKLVMVEGVPLAQSQEANGVNASGTGTGVQTGAIQRVFDAQIETRLQQANQASAQWDYMNTTLSQVESVLNEPSSTGLQNDLAAFWNSWSSVSTTPDSTTLRTTLTENAEALCTHIQYVYKQINSSIEDLNTATVDSVKSINYMAQQIGTLNSQIASMPSGTVETNALLDTRDSLVQDLSKLVSINQYGSGTSDFMISLGGRVLVQGTNVNELKTETNINGNQSVLWASDDTSVSIQGGKLKAVEDLRDTNIPDYLGQLNDLASTLVDKVNALNSTGKTLTGANGGVFFVAGTNASNIAVDSSIANNPNLIAASLNGSVGDGSIAAKIAALGEEADPVTGLSINQIYSNLVSDIGGATAMAKTQSTAQALSLQQYTTQEQSISGVSLDEEMTNMIKFQQAYSANARVLSVMNQMLGTLIDSVAM